jgi:hypothetical protein
VLTSGRDRRRWPDSDRRRENSGGDLRLGLLPRDTTRAPGNGETARAECGAGTWVCAAKAKHGPRARASKELGKSLPWRLTKTEQRKKGKRGLDGDDLQTRTGTA